MDIAAAFNFALAGASVALSVVAIFITIRTSQNADKSLADIRATAGKIEGYVSSVMVAQHATIDRTLRTVLDKPFWERVSGAVPVDVRREIEKTLPAETTPEDKQKVIESALTSVTMAVKDALGDALTPIASQASALLMAQGAWRAQGDYWAAPIGLTKASLHPETEREPTEK